MKKSIILLLVGIISTINIIAQDTTTVTAKSDDISENLDLEAVASVFGESKDLEDFEKRLNDPDTQISNLDLNEDGEVDYLRVMDNSKGDTKTVVIQAVISKDKYQDVAVIDINKDSKGETQVQVIGDVYMYGPAYIIEPVYVAPPVIFVWFWAPYYSPWYSPYHWGYYPPIFRPWHPYPIHRYHSNVHIHVSINSYHHTNVRINHNSVNINNKNRHNDYGKRNPNNSFERRNTGVSNKDGLNRSNNKASTQNKRSGNSTTGRKTQPNWQPSSRDRVPKSTRPTSKPSTRPTSRPSSRPTNNPSTRPTSRSSRPMPSRSMSSRRR